MSNEILFDYELALTDVAGVCGWAFDRLLDFRMMYKCKDGMYTRTDIWPGKSLTHGEVVGVIESCNEVSDSFDNMLDGRGI